MLRRYIQFLLVTLCGLITIGCANLVLGLTAGRMTRILPALCNYRQPLGGRTRRLRR